MLSNQASHHVDLLEWMMGEVDTVFAKSATALVNIEAEDTAVVLLRFRNGALGVIEATTATRPRDLEGSISILGEKGTVEIGGFAVNEMKVWNFVERAHGRRGGHGRSIRSIRRMCTALATRLTTTTSSIAS